MTDTWNGFCRSGGHGFDSSYRSSTSVGTLALLATARRTAARQQSPPGPSGAELMEIPAISARSGSPVSFGPVLDGDAVFVPDDIPRRGVFALWGTGSGTGKVEFVFARGADGLRKRVVTASFLSVAEALPELLSIEPNATGPAGSAVRPTLGVWAAAATAGVGWVARGRLLPTVGPVGMDAWRIGPLDAADLAWLRELAARFPPAAHALGVPGTRPMRIR